MYSIKVLSNGIRVVSEKMEYVRSVSVGVWIGNGSRFELPNENGMSHFIEHMLFKGTEKRDAKQIAYEMDSIGGQINAFTTKEYTCYYTKTLDEHINIALDILSDMIFSSKLDNNSMNMERNVVFEEINMCEDDPEEAVSDLISKAVYSDTSMGRPILGTKESLLQINPENMRKYIDSHYTSKNTVISVSGNFDNSLFELIEHFFGKRKISDNSLIIPPFEFHKGVNLVKSKDQEQVQLILGFESIDVKDERVYSLLAFNNIFGGGMSSRLFQNIREERGLVYSVYAYHTAYIDTGIFNIQAAMAPENVKEVCSLISDEIKNIKKNGLTDAELNMAKEQLKGSYILSYESVGARMQAAGRNLLLDKPLISSDEVIDRINKISHESIEDIMSRILNEKTVCVAAVGAIDSVDCLFDL